MPRSSQGTCGDQGRGMPQGKMHRLFQGFSRLHPDSKHTIPGSGLGLLICKGIVEADGGRIWAKSAGKGWGSTFSFTLPVAD